MITLFILCEHADFVRLQGNAFQFDLAVEVANFVGEVFLVSTIALC